MGEKQYIAWSIEGHGWLIKVGAKISLTLDIALASLFSEEYAGELHATGHFYCFPNPVN